MAREILKAFKDRREQTSGINTITLRYKRMRILRRIVSVRVVYVCADTYKYLPTYLPTYYEIR